MHAAALAAAGHHVVLVDPVPSQVQRASRHSNVTAHVGDARDLELPDNSFDAAMLFGPLNHLHAAHDRLRCLHEAMRVVVPGGLVFAAAIPRFVRHAATTLGRDVPHPYPQAWIDLLEHGTPLSEGRFPAGHFHTSEELGSEFAQAGLQEIELHAIEGLAGLALENVPVGDAETLGAALVLARRTGELPGIRDISTHVMAIGLVAR